MLCQRSDKYNLKAIHNSKLEDVGIGRAVSKIG